MMQHLYNELMALSENDDTPFFHSDQSAAGQDRIDYFRIFSYHFTDKDSWVLPSALESRGIMFRVTEDGEFIAIKSRPMQKFFNKGEENCATENIDYDDVQTVMTKADGSLISSYTNSSNQLYLKSKTSIGSDYAMLAQRIMQQDKELLEFVTTCEAAGWTVNMELVSPDPMFRIVLHYPEPKLIILNCRRRNTGEYMDTNIIPEKYFTGTVDKDALNHLDTATNIEGYVVMDSKGNWWKEKCAWYLARHRAKDFINQPNAFVELVLNDEADDVFSLLTDQPEILAEMEDLQHRVITKANTIVNNVTKYWADNKDMQRKDYAIKGKDELNGFEFSLAMKYYSTGADPDWNACLLTQIKKIDW